MFVIGYAAYSFVTESLNPFKKRRWNQPRYQHVVGMILWFAIATTPVLLHALQIVGFERRLLIGLIYFLSAFLCLGTVYFVYARIKAKKRGLFEPTPSRAAGSSAKTSQFAEPPEPERTKLPAAQQDDIPPIYIDADSTIEESGTNRRIKRKLLTEVGGEKVTVEY